MHAMYDWLMGARPDAQVPGESDAPLPRPAAPGGEQADGARCEIADNDNDVPDPIKYFIIFAADFSTRPTSWPARVTALRYS
eukprot:1155060-Pyramimonas_sp.AAC.1